MYCPHLSNSQGWPKAWLDLAKMYHTSDTNHFKHSIPVVGFWKLIFFFWTPRVGPRTPAANVSSITASISHKLLWKQGCFASTRNPQRLLNTKMHYQLCKYVPASQPYLSQCSPVHVYIQPISQSYVLLLLSQKSIPISFYVWAVLTKMYEHLAFIMHLTSFFMPWICKIHPHQILLYTRIFTLNDYNLCIHTVAWKSSPNLLV